jgi:hypothetical protein
MTTTATDDLRSLLARDRAALLAEAERVPRARWAERPAPDRWSIVEILEHVARIDTGVAKLLALRAADPRPAPPDELEAARLTPRRVALVRAPSQRFEAPERVRPTGAVAPDDAVEHLARARAALVAAYEAADPATLDGSVHAHPFLGPITLRGWVELSAHHDARHARQLAALADAWGAGPSGA